MKTEWTNYLSTFAYLVTMAFIHSSQGKLVCPPAVQISPCTCNTTRSSVGVAIWCQSTNLNDLQMSNVLNAFLSPGISPVVQFYASNNQLTKIPSQISNFTQLYEVSFYQNQITSVQSGAFNFTSQSQSYYHIINFYSNKISTVETGAFILPPVSSFELYIALKYNQLSSMIPQDAIIGSSISYATLDLSGNQITSIPQGYFNTFLNQSYSVNLDLGSNKITSIPFNTFNFPLAQYIILTFSNNKITTIPSGAFNFSSASHAAISLDANRITSISNGTFNFPLASYADISLNDNRITSIPSRSFNFEPNAVGYLDLGSNQITTIQPGALQYSFYYIFLGNNGLSRFDSGVFKYALQAMNHYGSYYVEMAKDPINCSSDPCHLAWLIRDNRQLLTHVRKAVCTNGTKFYDLSPYGYADCPTTC